MAINFPNSPTLYQISQVGDSFYIWNGSAWVGYSTSFTVNYNASSVVVQDNGIVSGATTTINFGDNLTVSYSSGIATITGAAGGGGSGESYWASTTAGIHTLSNVGIGTTNPISALTVSGSVRASSFVVPNGTSNQFLLANGSVTSDVLRQTNPSVNGDLTFGATDRISFDSDNDNIFKITFKGPGFGQLTKDSNFTVPQDGNNGEALITDGSGVLSFYTGLYLKSTGVGIGSTLPTSALTVQGDANISGVATATTFIGNLTGTATTAQGLTGSPNVVLGISTASSLNVTNTSNLRGTVTFGDPTGLGYLDIITGETQVGPSGISTIQARYNLDLRTSAIDAYITVPTDRYIYLRNSAGQVGVLFDGQANSNVQLRFNNSTKLQTIGAGVTITGTAFTNNLSVSGIATASSLQVERYGTSTGFGTFSASAGIATTLDSFTVATNNFKTAEYTIHIENGSNIQSQKVLIMQNSTTAYSQEYAVMYEPTLLVSIGATISGGNCIIQATPETGISGLTTFRFVRNTLL
jgi:hypothetical protein